MGHLQYLYFLKHHLAKDQNRVASPLVCVREHMCVCVCMCVCPKFRGSESGNGRGFAIYCVHGYSQPLYANVLIASQIRGGVDKSLVRPGRKQATATKLGIYSKCSPRSSIHFLIRCSCFCKPLKKNSEYCPSNQVPAAAMTSASNEKWRPFNCFSNPGNRW